MAMAIGLGILVVINDAGLHLEHEQHGVIFVHRVVAVHGPVAFEIAEAEEERVRLVELEPGHVLPCDLHGWHAVCIGAAVAAIAAAVSGTAPSVATISTAALELVPAVEAAHDPTQDLVLLEMDVDGVLPVVAGIDKDPVFRAVLFHGEAVDGAVGKLVVDDPLAVATIEDEVPCDARRYDA